MATNIGWIEPVFAEEDVAEARVRPDRDGYVRKVANVRSKKRVCLAELEAPDVTAADEAATPKTKALLRYLGAIAHTHRILYGHQNDMHRKVGKKLKTDSDTYDITGDYPAVVGVDGLALTGYELDLTECERASGLTLAEKLARVAVKADRAGAIVTRSWHMPYFSEVAERERHRDGRYDYSGYSPDHTDGNVVHRILPGGDLNEVFTGYLDLVTAFDRHLQQADVPLIFRPFHENTGSWFWWGAGHCTPDEFRRLFQYTEAYLQRKGLHNMLYAYSPGGGETRSEDDYSRTYPGDRFVDLTGFDMYHRDPRRGDGFLEKEFKDVLSIVEQFARAHHKVAAVTETGMLVGKSAMAKRHNGYDAWFLDAMDVMRTHEMAYFLTWSNFDETNFDQPYMVDATRGHEMINAFIDFYNHPASIFAGQNADYAAWERRDA